MDTVVRKRGVVVLPMIHVKMILLVSQGHSASQIGRAVNRSPRTVEATILTLRRKYKCKNVTHLVATFLRKKIIK